MNDYEKRLVANIEEHGWFCVSVLNDKGPSWNYSVGFAETLGAPEFIVFGLDPKLMHAMLWALFRLIRDGAPIPGNDDRVSGILSGHDCLIRDVHAENIVPNYLSSAIWRWGDPVVRGGPVPVRQLFWPDVEHGLFPWQPRCDPGARAAQPLLFEPPRRKGLSAGLGKLFH